MVARGKGQTVVITAIAREMAALSVMIGGCATLHFPSIS
jgi:hypothetical protein